MKIENIDLTERVFQYVRDAITAGKYEHGRAMKLPQLSQDLGVSQTPVREALIRLAEKGYLEKSGSRSYVIRTVSKEQYFELSKIRADMEASMIQRIIKNKLPIDMNTLQDIYDRQFEAMDSGNYEQGLILNRDFHGCYLSQSNIPQVVEFVESVCVIAGPILHGLKDRRFTTDKNTHFHAHILTALEKRDSKLAAEAVRSDIMKNAERICSFMPD